MISLLYRTLHNYVKTIHPALHCLWFMVVICWTYQKLCGLNFHYYVMLGSMPFSHVLSHTLISCKYIPLFQVGICWCRKVLPFYLLVGSVAQLDCCLLYYNLIFYLGWFFSLFPRCGVCPQQHIDWFNYKRSRNIGLKIIDFWLYLEYISRTNAYHLKAEVIMDELDKIY